MVCSPCNTHNLSSTDIVNFLLISLIYIYIYIYIYIERERCPWGYCYRCRKWTRWHEFKSWMKLMAFHIALILFRKVWIQLFSFQLYLDSRVDWVLLHCIGNQSWGRKSLNSNLSNSALKTDLISPPACRGVGKYKHTHTHTHIYIYILVFINSFLSWYFDTGTWKKCFYLICC